MSRTLRRSPSLVRRVSLRSARSREKLAMAEPESRWVASTVCPSSISRMVSGRASTADRVRASPESSSRCRSGPVPENARPSSSITTTRSRRSTELTSRSRLSSRVSVCSGVRVRSLAIRSPSARNGPPWDLGWRSTYCSPTADRFSTTASVSRGTVTPPLEPEVDVHAVVGEAQPVDPADGDAPVGDLGVLEDAAGLGEVDGHDVARPQEQVAEPDVAGADEADADHGDEQERRPAGP